MFPVPVDREHIHCFCLDLFATGRIRIVDNGFGPRLALELEGVEIVDIKPSGLEDSIECLVSATLQLGILPRLRIALDALTFDTRRLRDARDLADANFRQRAVQPRHF